MRHRQLSAALALALAATMGCEGRTSGFLVSGPSGAVRVRLMNALTPSQSVDFLVDGQVVASGIGFGAPSSYASLTVGSHRLQARASATGTTLLDFTRSLNSEGTFSLVPAAGLFQEGALLVTDDPTPASGQTRIRVVHVAAAPGSISVYVTAPTADLSASTPIVPSLAFGSVSGYISVNPGTYRVRVTRAGNSGDVLLDTGGFIAGAGSVRTFLVTDAPAGGLPTTLSIVADAN